MSGAGGGTPVAGAGAKRGAESYQEPLAAQLERPRAGRVPRPRPVVRAQAGLPASHRPRRGGAPAGRSRALIDSTPGGRRRGTHSRFAPAASV